MIDRFVNSDGNKKIFYIDAVNLYGWAMSDFPPYDEIKSVKKIIWEEILNIPDDSYIGYFLECYLSYPDNRKEKQRIFHFVLNVKLVLKIILLIT